MEIKNKSMTTTYEFYVFRNLCAKAIIGLDLLKLFKININPANKFPLNFQKGIFKKGIRLVERITVPARSQKIVEASVETSANIIITKHIKFDSCTGCPT